MAGQTSHRRAPSDSMRAALFQVDADWFVAYWNGDRTEPKVLLLARAVRQLGRALATTLAGRRHGAQVNPPQSADLLANESA